MRRLLGAALLLVSVLGAGQWKAVPIEEQLKPFTTDGCSAPVFLQKHYNRPEFRPACVIHDRAYWKGGSRRERLIADLKLALAIAELGFPEDAELMYAAVRLKGGPCTGMPYQWSFGRVRGCGYTEEK